jgi:DNA-binding NtrC family response regulator
MTEGDRVVIRLNKVAAGTKARQGDQMAAKRQEAKKLIDDLNALAEELATAKKPWPLRDARRAFERRYVQYVIAVSNGDRVEAAGRLDIGFSTLKEKIRRPGKWRWIRVN